MDDLSSVYETLRGTTGRRRAEAGEYARVVEFGPHEARAPIERSGSWLVTAGVPHLRTASQPPRVEDAEGQFAWISYDSLQDELTVATDPFGLFGVFTARRGGRTYVATSALALAKHLGARPSRFGIEAFLRAGYHFGTATNWDGIERLDPGTAIVFTSDGRRSRTYWRPFVDRDVSRMTLEETSRHCIEVASSTFADLLVGDPGAWADLTGGLDTRLLVLLLSRAGLQFRTNTTGDDASVDVRIARRVAAAGGWEWKQINRPPDAGPILEPLLPLSLAWGDGHLDVIHLAGTLWGHREKSFVHRSLFVGGGGEHLRNFAWKQEFLAAGKTNRVNMANWVDMRLLHALDLSPLADDPTPRVRADMIRRMATWAEPYSSERNTTQLDVMYAYKMTGHFGAYLSAAAAFLRVEIPLYLRPVFSIAFSADYRQRSSHRLQRRMMAMLDPRIAALATTNGGPAEPMRLRNAYRFLPYYADIGRRAVAKVSYKVSGYALLWPGEAVDENISLARRHLVTQLMENGVLEPRRMRSGSLYRARELEALVDRARRGDFTGFELLARIATVELALRVVDTALDE